MTIKTRPATQHRPDSWPFLFSVVPGRGLVKNVRKEAAPAKPRVKLKKARVYVPAK